WRRCRPVPGSLFVVGDPKQSIYRFRRADIVTYNRVRSIIEQTGGRVVHLTANVRTVGELVGWVNETVNEVFPAATTEFAPARRSMDVGRADACEADLRGVYVLPMPDDRKKKETVLEYEVEVVTRLIHHALATGRTV